MKTFLFIFAGIFLLGMLAAAFIFFTMPKKQPVPAAFSSYVGRWTNELGEYFVIYPNGAGDYKAGNSNVSGGTVVFKGDRDFSIAFGPFSKKFGVSESPSSAGGKIAMVVNGTRFTKYSEERAEAQKLTPQKAAELNKMHLDAFNRSIQRGDIMEFYKGISSLWKNEDSAENIQSSFKIFFDKKVDLTPWITVFPAEATLQNLEAGVVQAENYIVTDKYTLHIETKYFLVNGQFELVGFTLGLSRS